MITARLTAIAGGLLVFCASGVAKDIYVAQSSTGNGSGVDCADAHVYTWFNSAGNWGTGAGTISPGDTVHLCGTLTAPAGASGYLTFQGSGTSGLPITLKFETNAVIQSPYFVNGAIDMSGLNYVTVDGGTNGVIQNTANGTALTYQMGSDLIVANNCSNCEIKSLTIQNVYVHVPYTDTTPSNDACIYLSNGANSPSNISIHDNIMHDALWCIQYAGAGSNISIYNNRIYNVDHGIGIGISSGALSGINIYNNHIGDWANWDTTNPSGVGCTYHHDGIHIFAFGPGAATGTNIYNNLFDGDPGGNGCAGGHIYLEANNSNTSIFNNVFTSASTGPYLFVHIVVASVGETNPVDSVAVYNNTLLGDPTDLPVTVTAVGGDSFESGVFGMELRGATNLYIKNNVLTSLLTFVYALNPNTLATGGLNNNLYSSKVAGGQGGWLWNTGWYNTLATWKTATGQDGNALSTANAMLNVDGTVQVGSPVIGLGANLTSLGIGALEFDKAGKPRPGVGVWTAGAYNVGPAPPIGLTATSH